MWQNPDIIIHCQRLIKWRLFFILFHLVSSAQFSNQWNVQWQSKRRKKFSQWTEFEFDKLFLKISRIGPLPRSVCIECSMYHPDILSKPAWRLPGRHSRASCVVVRFVLAQKLAFFPVKRPSGTPTRYFSIRGAKHLFPGKIWGRFSRPFRLGVASSDPASVSRGKPKGKLWKSSREMWNSREIISWKQIYLISRSNVRKRPVSYVIPTRALMSKLRYQKAKKV